MNRRPGMHPATLFLLITVLLMGRPAVSPAQMAQSGAFSRMGFGARGIGMANAMTAVNTGDLVGYYNPAIIPWNQTRHASATFGVLSLDRSLNFLEYTQKLPPNAGITISLINAGVSNIEGTNADGEQTGALRTSENQVLLGFAILFPPGFSVGLNVKLYYYHLYTDINSTTVGLDFGVAYPISQDLTLAATVRDVNSKYKWDTSLLYGVDGQISQDDFPVLLTVGAAYRLADSLALLSVEMEKSNRNSLVARAGIEIPIIREVTVRGGIDRIDLKEKGNGVKPAFGFTLREDFERWTPALTYAYVFEPFSPSAIHMISLSVSF